MDTVRNYPPLAKADEDVLIARAVRGEAQAMAEMSGRYRGLIMAQAHASYLRCAALVQDAESIAVLAFIEALHDYDPRHGAPFAPFVKTRIHTALYTAYRRERRRAARTVHPEQDADGCTAWERCGGTEDTVACVERRLLVRGILARVMHRLTAREKELLSLHYGRDLTLRRIAALLGTSAGALSKSKANLLRKLRAGAGLPLASPCEI
ncbi:sigma-70 family RNA polymerase sigma factor [uncultured Selenomonas sp.]|uniref:sigma-70 family RNA polymerase sigma factor n=1 Tax=uncultured Selenomonas sp. TaxID=159275 RepID=UPI0028D5E6BA|nr:sigma-70 family RNA polymerase sigma factor [uncultured Selenomonas sp.]